MKRNKRVATISANAALIISGGIIAIGVVLVVTGEALSTAFNMGIALMLLGAVLIVLARRHPLKLTAIRLNHQPK